MSEFEGKSFHVVEKGDLDYVTGGAKVSENVDQNYKKKSRTNVCDCGKFERREPWMTLNICDNCKHATATSEDADIIFCSADVN